MSNDWNVQLGPKIKPKKTTSSSRKAVIPAAVWREHKHLAKVTLSAAIRRVQRGWTLLDAITTPVAVEDHSDNILEFLKKYPVSSRASVATAINKSSTVTLKFLESLLAAGKIYRTVGTTSKNRPVYFYGVADEAAPELSEVFDIEAEKNWKAKPFVNPIRQRALDDLEKLKKMKQK